MLSHVRVCRTVIFFMVWGFNIVCKSYVSAFKSKLCDFSILHRQHDVHILLASSWSSLACLSKMEASSRKLNLWEKSWGEELSSQTRLFLSSLPATVCWHLHTQKALNHNSEIREEEIQIHRRSKGPPPLFFFNSPLIPLKTKDALERHQAASWHM